MTNAALVTLGSVASNRLSTKERHFISTSQPAGVTLFSRNISKRKQKESFQFAYQLQSLRRAGDPPYCIAVDQEGGRVSRFKQLVPDLGPSLYLEEGKITKDSLLAIRNYGNRLGSALNGFGVNINFAPVVDLLTTAANHAIGDRAFSDDISKVVLRSEAFLDGLHQGGVFGCLKHFPGLGSVRQDTHFVSGVSDVSWEVLNQRDLVPYHLLAKKAQLIMVSHCRYANICAVEATRSPFLLTELLRHKIGFKGLTVSDDMMMNAVNCADIEWKEFMVESIAAGCDLILICNGLDRWRMAIEALSHRAKKSRFFSKRLETAATKVMKFRERLPFLA